MATIYLNNMTKTTVQWSIEYGSKDIDGDQEGLSFTLAAVEFAPSYTVCYWTDPARRKCVNLSDGDAANYTGDDVIRTMGG